MYTQVSDLNAAHIYACLRGCVSVCVCVRYLFAAVKYSTLCRSFSRVSLSLAAAVPSPHHTTTHRSRALRLTRFPYSDTLCILFLLLFFLFILSHCTSATTDEPTTKLANPRAPFVASAPSFTFEGEQEGGKWEVNRGGGIL